MIKLLPIRLVLLAVLCFGSFLVIEKCFASEISNMDGTIYPIAIEKLWAINVVNNNNGTYTSKKFECNFTTSYTGKSGVQINIKQNDGQSFGKDFVVTNVKPFVLDIASRTSSTAPFKQPALVVTNEGCSKYLDGDVCKNDLNDRPIVYGSCVAAQ